MRVAPENQQLNDTVENFKAVTNVGCFWTRVSELYIMSTTEPPLAVSELFYNMCVHGTLNT